VSDYRISPSQGVQLLALADMLKRGDLSLRGEPDDEQAAASLVADVAQEIALQTGVVE
jgi:hypothetical protein